MMSIKAHSEPDTTQRLPKLGLHRLRDDFPALTQLVHGKPLTYLDSAATSLKPYSVVEALRTIYERDGGNIHRAVHRLSEAATERYEAARETIARFIGGRSDELVFVRGATEGLNLLAATLGEAELEAGDEILISSWEHHANIVPWQLLAKRRGVKLRVVELPLDALPSAEQILRAVGPKTRCVALTQLSNVLGVSLPIAEVAAGLRGRGIRFVVDGAQAVPHQAVDVHALGVDAYVFSGHKLYGPTGIGALWVRRELLETLPPYQGGGDMIDQVCLGEGETSFAAAPGRFEAGTPHIAGAVGLAAACDYLRTLGWERVRAEESSQCARWNAALRTVPGLRLLGPEDPKASLWSFVCDWGHALDIATFLDLEGVAVRVGHHCAQPLHQRLGVSATLRVSLGIYNDMQDVERFLKALHAVRRRLS